MESAARYIIGIDLGTTNCSVSYVDTDTGHNPALSVQQFRIPQLLPGGCVEASSILPSFCLLEQQPGKDGRNYSVGLFAREEGAKVPTRLVSSAKSWLCNSSSNRREKILPVESAEESLRISPVEASARILIHIKEAWDDAFAKSNLDAAFENQDIIITVPASFDEVARTLTVEAAKAAGYVRMTLLEEPQAAFYSWISHHEKKWESLLKQGDSILVCDIGGGTTDFSLIDVQDKEGKLSFQRVAVGRHLLLGGDNMDASVAHLLEAKFKAEGLGELDTAQWHRLKHEARRVKEVLLSGKEHATALLQGGGSRVVEGTLSVDVTATEVQQMLLDGYFGNLSWDDAIVLKKGSGIRSLGLPYEAEASIVKHLAHFLKQAGKVVPNYVLFNGGTMKPVVFQDEIISSLENWYGKTPQLLVSSSLDHAVARGAAYFGKVRRGLGVKIHGGIARSLYLGVEIDAVGGSVERKALTLLPRGTEPGSAYSCEHVFSLSPNSPVVFPLYSSHVRLDDNKGDLVAIDAENMLLLPPIRTVLKFGKQGSQDKIPVKVEASLSEIGTLELWLQAEKSQHRWRLEFQLSDSTGEENVLRSLDKARSDMTFETSFLKPALDVIRSAYQGERASKPKEVMPKLELVMEMPRERWSPSVLRGLWDVILEQALHRKVSSDHESRWWNLVGFVLRPGYGYPLDDFRVKQLWKILLGDKGSSKSPECQIQQWICFRRLAGGLSKGQQMQLANELVPQILDKRTGLITLKGKGDEYAYSEKIRAFAAMELVDLSVKIKIGNALVKRLIEGEALPCDAWALGRIGARQLFYGSLANVVPVSNCLDWIDTLINSEDKNDHLAFVIAQLARKTEHREINLPQEAVDRAAAQLAGLRDKGNLERLLHHESSLTLQEQEHFLGDQLPIGLTLHLP